MYEYTRPVYYYETDQMGVVHHSNYIKWLEEARTEFFKDVKLAYVETERLGVRCPITEINIKYKHPSRFGDNFKVFLKMTQYTGVRFRIKYEVINDDGRLLALGETSHAFIDKNHKPISLSSAIPERHEEMKKLIVEEQL